MSSDSQPRSPLRRRPKSSTPKVEGFLCPVCLKKFKSMGLLVEHSKTCQTMAPLSSQTEFNDHVTFIFETKEIKGPTEAKMATDGKPRRRVLRAVSCAGRPEGATGQRTYSTLRFLLTRQSSAGDAKSSGPYVIKSFVNGEEEGAVTSFALFTTASPWKLIRSIQQGQKEASRELRVNVNDRFNLLKLEQFAKGAGVPGLEGLDSFFKCNGRRYVMRRTASRRSFRVIDETRMGAVGGESLKSLRSIARETSWITVSEAKIDVLPESELGSQSDALRAACKEFLGQRPAAIKAALRNGVNPLYRPVVWSNLVLGDISKEKAEQLEDQFDADEQVLWHGHVPETKKDMHTSPPDFGGKVELLHSHPLTRKAVVIVKRLLCLFHTARPSLQYCPMLPDLFALLLLHVPDWQAFELVKTLVDRSQEDEFYLPVSGARFMSHVETLQQLVRARLRDLWDHVEKIQVELEPIISVWFARLFVGFLRYDAVLRVFDSFVYEGGKILFRVGLAVLQIHRQRLLECTTARQFNRLLPELMMLHTPKDLLMRAAFAITSFSKKMLRRMHSTATIQSVPFANVTVFHVPEFTSSMSRLLKVNDMRVLWRYIDPVHAIQDPLLLFRASDDGYNLSTMRDRILAEWDSASTHVVLAVKDSTNAVFGAFLHMERGTEGGGGLQLGSHTFVFSTSPSMRVHEFAVEVKTSRAGASKSERNIPRVFKTDSTDDLGVPTTLPIPRTKLSRIHSAPEPKTPRHCKPRKPVHQVRRSTIVQKQIASLTSQLWFTFTQERLALGSKGRTILSLDSKLGQGSSQSSSTFANPQLHGTLEAGKTKLGTVGADGAPPLSLDDEQDFRVLEVELWGLTI